MPFEQCERTPLNFADGRIASTFTVAPRPNEPSSLQIPFEVWWYQRDVSVQALVMNPTLDITLFPSMGNGSWNSNAGVRLPIVTGDLSETGGILGNSAVIWRPFAVLSTELVVQLDALRHPEFGLKANMKLNAAIIPLGQPEPVAGRPAARAQPTPYRWDKDLQISNELWREWLAMMGHPRPRVFELHPLSFSDLSEFEIACGKLRDAERQFFLGHWGQAIALSRSVVEAIFRHLGYKGDRSYDWASIEAAGLPKEMSALFRAFNNVANLENHPTGDHGWRRADARFMLQLAASLAEYAGTLPQK